MRCQGRQLCQGKTSGFGEFPHKLEENCSDIASCRMQISFPPVGIRNMTHMCKELEEAFGAVVAPDPETFGLYTVTLDHIPASVVVSTDTGTTKQGGGVSILWIFFVSLLMTGCTLGVMLLYKDV